MFGKKFVNMSAIQNNQKALIIMPSNKDFVLPIIKTVEQQQFQTLKQWMKQKKKSRFQLIFMAD